MELTQLHERMIAAAGGRTYRHLSELTRTNSETVRRYMNGQSPSAEFLQAFCLSLGLSGTWLLTGAGPMKSEDLKGEALKMADPSDLLGAMASTVEGMLDRVSRLELYVQTLETRVRASRAAAKGPTSNGQSSGQSNGHASQIEALHPVVGTPGAPAATIRAVQSDAKEPEHAQASKRAKRVAQSIKPPSQPRTSPKRKVSGGS